MKIRLLIVTISIAVSCFAACNYTDGECWPVGQTNGNAGVGTGPIVQSGAGSSNGDAPSQGTSGAACNSTPSSSDTPSPPEEMGTYIRCRGLDPMTCEALCFDIGATCAGLKTHPYGSKGGIGRLKQCESSPISHTCTYCYANGDVCTFLHPGGVPFCGYTGGKGCE